MKFGVSNLMERKKKRKMLSDDFETDKETDDLLFRFLSGTGKNYEGRYLYDIWEFAFSELESYHDYIQWIFPLKEESLYNRTAPVIEDETKYQTKEIKDNMLRTLDVMLHFYGLRRCGNEIVKGDDFVKRKNCWVTKSNHNFLRITRILKSLKMFGFEKEAQMFFDQLEKIYQDNRNEIGNKTFQYWKDAVENS